MHRGAFASFLSGGFTTIAVIAVINPREKKVAKRTFVLCNENLESSFYPPKNSG